MVHAMRKRGEGRDHSSLVSEFFLQDVTKSKRGGVEIRCHITEPGWSGRTGGSAVFAAETNESRRGDPAIAAVDVVRRWWQGSFPVCQRLTGSGV